MSALSTTYSTYSAKGLREDLENVIYNISPTDTPFMSNGGRVSVKATTHEWQTDSLAAVDTANAKVQGDNLTAFTTVAASTRVGNYTQISRKDFSIAGTTEIVDKAGRASELAYQAAKKAKELKRDMEAIALENIAGVAASSGVAPTMATMGAWIKTNVATVGTSGVSPAWTSGVPGYARTDGSTRAITETLFKSVAQKVFTAGGTLSMVLAGPVNKQNISKMSGIATKYNLARGTDSPMTIIGAADMYVTDFGNVQIVCDRFQRETDVWFVDPEYYGFGYLRPFQQVPLAKTGDAENRMLLVEWTLVMKNEAAHGLVPDCDSVIQ